jgi:F-type H+-transporting ATPase subunit gamma
MSGQLKEVRIRIKSVTSTQQITKAMKMVAAAKLRRAQDAIIQMRPYANKLNTILSKMVFNLGSEFSMNLAEEREINNILVILITSDRGLAGSYNSTLIKKVEVLLKENYKTQYAAGRVTLMTIGNKGKDYFLRRSDYVDSRHFDLFTRLNFNEVSNVADEVIHDFSTGKYDKVEVVYSQFKNAAVQIFKNEQYLPILKPENDSGEEEKKVDYIFEPEIDIIINHLVPKILKTQFFKFMLEANASEQGARMTAMDKATENANDLLKELRLKYNRARQAAITTELNEIVSGAAALEG